ncbi:MAG TPA: lipid A-modifier LpxR family protein [Bacteroidia bacterium]|nr:lipid A-modifier LpxR family protein [Bacteroidia bacterium]
MGWNNQISNGGELTFMYLYNQTKLISSKQLDEKINTKKRTKYIISYNLGYNIGYLTQATSGITFKFGRLYLSNWATDLFNQLNTVSQIIADENEKEMNLNNSKKQYELYLFVNISPALTLYNGSLHGGISDTKYRLPYWETGFINAQGRVGPAWTTKYHSLAIYYAIKTPEMWNSYKRLHSWGGASLSFYWK